MAKRPIVNDRFSAMPNMDVPIIKVEYLETGGKIDFNKTISLLARYMGNISRRYVFPFVGVSAPGAWQYTKLPYLGTVEQMPEIGDIRVAEKLNDDLGGQWEVEISNNEVARTLAMTQKILFEPDKYPTLASRFGDHSGNIVSFMPDSEFKGGAFSVKDGIAHPVPGPQMFSDIIVRVPNSLADDDNATLETLCSKNAIVARAKQGLIGELYPSQEIGFDFVKKMAFLRDDSIPYEARAVARALFKNTAAALVDAMRLTYFGGDSSCSRKAVVNTPYSAEDDFWDSVRGTELFVLGGFLCEPDIRAFLSKQIEKMHEKSQIEYEYLFLDEGYGRETAEDKATNELIGASLLLPSIYAYAGRMATDKRIADEEGRGD